MKMTTSGMKTMHHEVKKTRMQYPKGLNLNQTYET